MTFEWHFTKWKAPNSKNDTSVTFKYELIEPLLIFTICYVSYLVAEMMELSAILAIIFCAFVMMHRVDKRLSKDSHVVIRNGLKEPHFPNSTTHTVWPKQSMSQFQFKRPILKSPLDKWNTDDVPGSGNYHLYPARCDMCWGIDPFGILEYCLVLCHTLLHNCFQIFIRFLADVYFELYSKGNRFNTYV